MRPAEPQLPKPKNFLLSASVAKPLEKDAAEAGTAAAIETTLKMSDLTPTERSAASLGVDPDAWRPIGWLNEGHYESLLKENRIDAGLAQSVEAFRFVAAGGK